MIVNCSEGSGGSSSYILDKVLHVSLVLVLTQIAAQGHKLLITPSETKWSLNETIP